MDVVVGRHTGQSHERFFCMLGDAGEGCGDSDHAAFLLRSSGRSRTGIGRSSVKGLRMG